MKVGIIYFSKCGREEAERICNAVKEEGEGCFPIDAKTILLYAGEDDAAAFSQENGLRSFDSLVFLPEEEYFEFAYMVMKIVDGYTVTSIPCGKFRLFFNRALIQRFLASHNLSVRKVYAFSEATAANFVLKELKLPVILQFPDGRRIPIKSEDTFTELISGIKRDTVITAEKPLKPEFLVWTLVIGDEVIACEKKGESISPFNAPSEIIEKSLKVSSLLSTFFCQVNFIPYRNSFLVNEVRLFPDFALFEKITGKNVYKILASSIISKTKERKKEMIKRSISQSINGIKRWLLEIGIIGSRREKIQ